MDKCSRCSKPIQNGATKVTTDKTVYAPDKIVYASRIERFYTLCGYCMEDLEEFLSRKEEEM